MKQRPSVGTDITKKDVEKLPPGFVDVALTSKPASNGAVEHEIPATYEDALANLGYENTEVDDTDDGKEKEKQDQNGPKTQETKS